MGVELINRRMMVELGGWSYDGSLYGRRVNRDPIFTDMDKFDRALTDRKWVTSSKPSDRLPARLNEWTSVKGQGLTIHEGGGEYNDHIFDGQVKDGDIGVFIGFIKMDLPEFVFIKVEHLMPPGRREMGQGCLLSEILDAIIPDLEAGLSSKTKIWIGHSSCRTGHQLQLKTTEKARRLSMVKSSSMNCYLKSFIIMIMTILFGHNEAEQSALFSMSYDKLHNKLHGFLGRKGFEDGTPRHMVETTLSQIINMNDAFASKGITKMSDFYDVLAQLPNGADVTREWVTISGEWTGKCDVGTAQKEYEFIMKYLNR